MTMLMRAMSRAGPPVRGGRRATRPVFILLEGGDDSTKLLCEPPGVGLGPNHHAERGPREVGGGGVWGLWWLHPPPLLMIIHTLSPSGYHGEPPP